MASLVETLSNLAGNETQTIQTQVGAAQMNLSTLVALLSNEVKANLTNVANGVRNLTQYVSTLTGNSLTHE